MALRLVGAGLGRTGTLSLKLALERLLGGRCYHMAEVVANPGHVQTWAAAAKGEPVDWAGFFDDYVAAVDWPAASFWPEISAAFPDELEVEMEPDEIAALSRREAMARYTALSRALQGCRLDDETKTRLWREWWCIRDRLRELTGPRRPR